MRKFYIFALVATMFAACATDGVNESSAVIGDLAPETLTVSFEGEESRIQLQDGKTVWNEGDLVSVFYRSNANQKWQFQGATGDRTGNLKRVEMGTATETMNRVVVVYPYAENYYINPETCNVEVSLPAQQTYVADSYGVGGNIMVSSGEYNQVVLKSVCGWLKLELTGNGEKISTITLKGNNGEQVAGQLYINSADATATLASEMGGADDNGSAGGNLVFEDTILKEVTLNCGDGVVLGAEPTAFYIALPPQTFEKGILLDIVAANDSKMTKSTDKEVAIERNHILPMEEFEVEFEKGESIIVPPNNEIWYTSFDGEIVTPSYTDGFGANIVSNTYDAEKECWVIKFDGDVTTIGGGAFEYCTSLTSVNIPDSVTTIRNYAFEGCTSLTSITIPNSVTSIVWSVFSGCSSLQEFNGNFASEDGRCIIIEGSLKLFAPAGLTEYTIPDSVTSIGDYAFAYCTSLTSVTIPDSVTSFGYSAFVGCSNLKEFNGKSASKDGRCLIIDGILYLFAPAGLTEYAIPDSVTSIGENAFYNCSSLTGITIPNSVTSIGNYAFHTCTSLTSVIIPDSVTSIGNYAFRDCSLLTSVTIGNRVTSIGKEAFRRCNSLKEVYCKPTAPPTGGDNYMFSNNASGRKIYVPSNSVSAYKSAEYWKNYASQIVGYNF